MSITFIIIGRNEENYLPLSVGAVAALGFDKEIIYVDNGSTDRSVEVAVAHGAKVIVIEDVSLGALRNVGAKNSTGSRLCFLDADVVVDEKWFQRQQEILDDDCVACVCAPEKWYGDHPTWVEKSWLIHGMEQTDAAETVQWCSTQAMTIKKEAFFEIGGFNETLKTCEDYDLGMRLSRRYKIVRTNGVYHFHMRPSKKLPEFFLREFWRGQSNIKGVLSHGLQLKELPSLVVPLLWGAGLLVLICSGLALGTGGGSVLLVALSLAMLIGFPLLMALRGYKRHASVGDFVQFCFLCLVFIAARSFALFIPIKRTWG